MQKLTKAESARINGAKSRGPVTPEGKTKSCLNAVKHGAYSSQTLLATESKAVFDEFACAIIQEHQPADTTEVELITQMINAAWKRQRFACMEIAAVNHKISAQQAEIDAKFSHIDPATRTMLAYEELTLASPFLKSLQTVTAECLRHYDRALRTLEKRRAARPPFTLLDEETPAPTPESQPEPEPQPDPTPEPAPDPTPDPTPEPQPDPTPDPTPEPANTPAPDPTPKRDFKAEFEALQQSFDRMLRS